MGKEKAEATEKKDRSKGTVPSEKTLKMTYRWNMGILRKQYQGLMAKRDAIDTKVCELSSKRLGLTADIEEYEKMFGKVKTSYQEMADGAQLHINFEEFDEEEKKPAPGSLPPNVTETKLGKKDEKAGAAAEGAETAPGVKF